MGNESENSEQIVRDNQHPIVRRYAVAVTLIQNKAFTVNVQTVLSDVSAYSEDEARGAANRVAQLENPDHSIFTTLVRDFTPNPGVLPPAAPAGREERVVLPLNSENQSERE